MADFQYTTVPGKLGELLTKIRTVGVPDKATVQWLKSIGFSSSNDSSLLKMLKFVDFYTPAGVPTERRRNYRGRDSKSVLGLAIQHGYSDLFAVYSDAQNRSDTELTSFFSTHSNAGQQAIGKTVSTFKTLCANAEFGADSAAHAMGTAVSPVQNPPSKNPAPTSVTPSRSNGPEVHINVQIHISPEASADQIDQIFSSMAKHLYGRSSE